MLTVPGVKFPTIMRTDPILIRPLSSKATPCPDPKASLFFLGFEWLSPWILRVGKGRDRQIWIGPPRCVSVVVVMEAGSTWHTCYAEGIDCQRNLSQYAPNLRDDIVTNVVSLCRLFHLRLLRHALEPEAEPVLGASISSCGGKSSTHIRSLPLAGLAESKRRNATWTHLSKMQARERQIIQAQRTSESATKGTNHSSLPFDTFPRSSATHPRTELDETHQSQSSSEHIGPSAGKPAANSFVKEEHVSLTKPPQSFLLLLKKTQWKDNDP